MAEQRVHRRLAAILAADVVGYSRMMEADEAGTLTRLKALRADFLHPTVEQFGGRIVKTIGDGTLIEFPSAVDAVRNAVEVQKGMRERNADGPESERIELRIGINVGDIVIEGDDIYGDGVNVAARLEGIAEPGGICVSASVREQVRNNIDVTFEDIGDQQVKNIARPIRAYRVVMEPHAASLAHDATTPNKPSIAVLPFINLSGDPEQEYFADGMVDEIITSLARIHGLIVTARTSTFMFKGQNADIREIARKLNVRYVLEGSVRKGGDRLRIIGQLIDADTGAHIWADRVDGKLDDIFDLQDRITESVVGAIAPKLQHAEMERAKRKRPESLDAYDYHLRALVHFHHPTREGVIEAMNLLERGLAIDPNYAPLNATAAWFHFYRIAALWSPSFEEDRAEAVRLARVAIEYDDGDSFGLSLAGFLLASMGQDVEDALAAVERALALGPNSAPTLNQAGYTLMFAGDQERALKVFNAAVRLSPSDPLTYRALTGACGASVLAGRYAEAVAYGEEARRLYAGWPTTLRFLVAAYAQSGDAGKSAETMAALLRIDPNITISHMRSYQPYRKPEQAERLWEGFRKAGMPE